MNVEIGKFGEPVVPDVIPNDGRNYELRSIPEIPYIGVTRDGEVRYQKGREQYDSKGARYDPRRFVRNPDGTPISIQMFVHKAFPDIPMRVTPTW